MKLARGVSGDRLIRALEQVAYEVIRQNRRPQHGRVIRLHRGPLAPL